MEVFVLEEVVVARWRITYVRYACALCGTEVLVKSPPAQHLVFYGPSAEEAEPICPSCFAERFHIERERLWIKTLRG